MYEELYDVWVVERPTTRPGQLVFVNCSAASCSEIPAELGARKLQVFRVVPANKGTRKAIAEAVLATRAYVTVAALSLALHGRGCGRPGGCWE
ncbi:MAG: hypothetical protein QW290_07720 [Sulfolobales archaeon]